MGTIGNVGKVFLKYSEEFVNKTEIYARIAKIYLDINRLETEKNKIFRDLGKMVITEIESGKTAISAQDETISRYAADSHRIDAEIASKREEINALKNAAGTDQTPQ